MSNPLMFAKYGCRVLVSAGELWLVVTIFTLFKPQYTVLWRMGTWGSLSTSSEG